MKSQGVILQQLNEILTGELTAISQYFLHSRMLENWGYSRLAKTVYHESIEEMKHAQSLTDRILFLEGVPNLQKLNPLNIGESVEEQIQSDKKLEEEAIEKLKAAIQLCHDKQDFVSKGLLEGILNDEEKHLDWLEAQLQIIADIGIQNYLAQQISP